MWLNFRGIYDDDRVCEDRRAYQSLWSKTVHLHQESRDSSCENVSPCADRAEVDSHASCPTKNTFAQLAGFGHRGTGIDSRLSVH